MSLLDSRPPRRIAVTGASGYIGAQLVRRLEAESQIDHILAIDVVPPNPEFGHKVHFLNQSVSDIFDQAFADHGIEAAAHLAYAMRPSHDWSRNTRINIGGTQNLLTACATSAAHRIVYLSSSTVYGATPNNPPFITEDIEPRPPPGFQYSEEKVASEHIINQFSYHHPDVNTAILRCCPIVGPNADNFVARAFLRPKLVRFRRHDPPMQLIHEEDVTEALTICLLTDVSGTYNLAGDGIIYWSEMATALGHSQVTLPSPLLHLIVGLSWALGLQNESPRSALELIKHRWTVSTRKAREEIGIPFRYSSREAWESFARRHRCN